MKRLFIAPLAGAVILFNVSCAYAQWGGPSYGGGSYNEIRREAFDNGYRQGLEEGGKDGRQGDRFEYRDERDFQRADYGYRRGFGDRERYQQSFRAGFVEGYTSAYRRQSRGYGDQGRWGRDQYISAFDLGARDGFEKGVEDARDRDRFDARRHKWYRDGDRHYESRFGPRERYKDEYRRGFLAGYERGYRGLR